MPRLPALLAALLLPTAQPLLLGAAVSSGTLLVSQPPAQAQSAEAVAKVAQAITVRIEGATQGSGVLVEREGNRYTVLTAWHVVSGQRPGEELDIFTPDGQRHRVEQGSIKRLGEVDMSILSFSSSSSYELARVGDVKTARSGEQVLVAGFPSASNGKLKYDSGKLVANAAVGIDQGYQLLYTNDTISGMSGGVVLKADGTLIGMHGRGESDDFLSLQAGRQIKTGINQGVPILYYSLYAEGLPVVASISQATSADDYLAQARSLINLPNSSSSIISLATRSLAIRESSEGYFLRGLARGDQGDNRGAEEDYSASINIDPIRNASLYNRGLLRKRLGNYHGAVEDYTRLLSSSQFASALVDRGIAKDLLGDKRGALDDFNNAVLYNFPGLARAYYSRGLLRSSLGDTIGAIGDYTAAIKIDPSDHNSLSNRGMAWADLGQPEKALSDLNRAIELSPAKANAITLRGLIKIRNQQTQSGCSDLAKAMALGYNRAYGFYAQACR